MRIWYILVGSVRFVVWSVGGIGRPSFPGLRHSLHESNLYGETDRQESHRNGIPQVYDMPLTPVEKCQIRAEQVLS
jgi:hypothetical protein